MLGDRLMAEDIIKAGKEMSQSILRQFSPPPSAFGAHRGPFTPSEGADLVSLYNEFIDVYAGLAPNPQLIEFLMSRFNPSSGHYAVTSGIRRAEDCVRLVTACILYQVSAGDFHLALIEGAPAALRDRSPLLVTHLKKLEDLSHVLRDYAREASFHTTTPCHGIEPTLYNRPQDVARLANAMIAGFDI